LIQKKHAKSQQVKGQHTLAKAHRLHFRWEGFPRGWTFFVLGENLAQQIVFN
jgi:hypothetical protein